MQVSSQYKRILQVRAAGTLQQYPPSTLLIQVVSSLHSSYASSYVEAVEKVPKQILGRDAEKSDPLECATINDLTLGKGQVTPENIVLTRQKDFSYRLVRYHKAESCVCNSQLLPGVSFVSSSQIPPISRWHHYRFDTQHATSCFDHRYGVRGISNQSMASVVNEVARAGTPFEVCAANSLLRSLLRSTAVEPLSRRVARLVASLSFSFNHNICHL